MGKSEDRWPVNPKFRAGRALWPGFLPNPEISGLEDNWPQDPKFRVWERGLFVVKSKAVNGQFNG